MKQVEQYLLTFFEQWAGERATGIIPLPPSGSYRQYYRIKGHTQTAIGVFNPDRKENIAFLEFSRHFQRKGLPAPRVYADDIEHTIYLIEDLGDTTLFSYVSERRLNGAFPHDVLDIYTQVLDELPRFQVVAAQNLNDAVCYPRARFDRQSMLWDLNYFKYYFLKLARIPFDEQDLEDDFHTLTGYLLQADCEYFLYRDFQSRNIMLHDGRPYFIDYQGGRRGALQYDPSSLLYDAKADLPPAVREELLRHYLQALRRYVEIDEQQFLAYYDGYALIRMMQAMGAFGFRGFYEKKTHFLQSVPYAVNNLAWLLEHANLPPRIPELISALYRLVESETLQLLCHPEKSLTVRIQSFSYKHGVPVDGIGHDEENEYAGGYVFDCRALPNPGRYEQYQPLTGQDEAVIEFFRREPGVEHFLHHVFELVDRSVEYHQQRGFPNLTVNFGCTGGRHRSVYCAERLARHLREKYGVHHILRHLEQQQKNANLF